MSGRVAARRSCVASISVQANAELVQMMRERAKFGPEPADRGAEFEPELHCMNGLWTRICRW